jgi:hypothetical protein
MPHPFIFLDKTRLLFLIYVGDKTYASIKQLTSFIDALASFQPE